MELDILGSAESFALTVSRLPGGKFSVRSGTSQIETVILADRVLAAAFRPTSSLTPIELPSPRLRRLKPTTSETCFRREIVSARFTETSLRHSVTPLRSNETPLLKLRPPTTWWLWRDGIPIARPSKVLS